MPSPGAISRFGDDLFPVASRVADPKTLPPFAIEEDGEQFVRDHAPHDLGHACEQFVEIQRLAGQRGHFEQEVQ